MNPVGYFEIPVTNLNRAMTFYEFVFEFEFEMATIDGLEMALFPINDNDEGITGALVTGESYVPSHEGSRVYFNTHNINETLKRVESCGGKTLYPKTSVGELGWVAEFEDSEGNRIALHAKGTHNKE